jgi:hypothetical protein
VNSVAGRHFRVTEAWWEEPPRRKPGVPGPRVEIVPPPEPAALALPGSRWGQLALPEPSGPAGVSPVAVHIEPPDTPLSGAAAPAEPPRLTLALPVSAVGAMAADPRAPETSRVLVSLLARLWLLSSVAGGGGSVAAPSPPRAAPEPPRPLAAPEPPTPAEPLPPLAPPEAEPPWAPEAPLANNGFPRSGLGEFMVEVARASEPPAPLTAVEPAERVTVMIELPRQLHCHRFVDDTPVSRDKCRLFDRIEKPLPPVAQ